MTPARPLERVGRDRRELGRAPAQRQGTNTGLIAGIAGIVVSLPLLVFVLASRPSAESKPPASTPGHPPTSTPGPPPTVPVRERQDPLADFEAFCAKLVQKIDKTEGIRLHNKNLDRWQVNSFKVSPGTYGIDVRATQSLASPYIGILQVRVMTLVNGEVPDHDENQRLTFAYQKGEWIYVKGERCDYYYGKWYDFDCPGSADPAASEFFKKVTQTTQRP